MKEIDVAVIKGNASELLALMDADTTMKGTDSDQDLDAITIAKNAYKQFDTAIAITGETDIVIQDNKMYKLSNGSPLLAK